MTTSDHPLVGRTVRASTYTEAAQACVVHVTAVEEELEGGWVVWGYRQHKRRQRFSGSFPRQYLVAKSAGS